MKKTHEKTQPEIRPARRVQGLKPSSVFQLLQKAKDLTAQGRDIVSLSIGEPEWDTFEVIKTAGIKAIREGHTKYTPSAGREALREKLSRQVEKDFGLPFGPENVLISAGCKYALFTLFQCLCDPGDEVILPAPYWVSYPNVMELSGAKCKIVSAGEETGFKITPEQLKSAVTKKTKFFLLNSPNNPTSAIYSPEELSALGEILKSHPRIILITDDIYNRLVFEGEQAPHILSLCPFLKDRAFMVNGASKSYLMTGWRIAWIIGPKRFIKTLSSFQSQSISCVHSISQKAVEDSLSLCEESLSQLREKLKGLRDHFSNGIKGIPGFKPYPSEGGFYLWVGIKDLLGREQRGEKITSSRNLMEQLLHKGDLLCLSGEDFGAPGHLRFNYAVSRKTLDQAILRLTRFTSELT